MRERGKLSPATVRTRLGSACCSARGLVEFWERASAGPGRRGAVADSVPRAPGAPRQRQRKSACASVTPPQRTSRPRPPGRSRLPRAATVQTAVKT